MNYASSVSSVDSEMTPTADNLQLSNFSFVWNCGHSDVNSLQHNEELHTAHLSRNESERDGRHLQHAGKKRKMRITFLSQNMKGRNGDGNIRDNIKMDLK
jgi:hypothetical protein